MNPNTVHLPVIDLIKAVASQLIVWHHLIAYTPMGEVVYPVAPDLGAWLYDDARIAVQAFLVIGGFLAMRSLFPALQAAPPAQDRLDLPRLLWRRYRRLAAPYLVALAAALVAAAVARQLVQHVETPAAPSLAQVLAHIVLLQDILDVQALSTGVWYVAIDFQLYALLAALIWLARRIAAATGVQGARLVFAACLGLIAASLLWVNLDPELEMWAPYFFGAYGMGVMAYWLPTHPRRVFGQVVLAALVVLALVVEWRSRILVAGVTAAVLALAAGGGLRLPQLGRASVTGLGRISYAVFLIHYPVCLVVGAIVMRLSPTGVAANAFGMVCAWLLSLTAGVLLYRLVERRITTM